MSREIDPVVYSFTHLQDFPRPDEALHMLKRIASLVKPIMRARGWRVKVLSEMYSDQANLLGLNNDRGFQILIRLREPYDRTQFFPFEKVVDTMLHELAHIVHGPHDHKFHALWDELREDLEGLMMKGYTGEGFLSNGQRLGGRYLPPDEARRLARAEAERRRPPPAFGFGGHRLGGAAPPPGRDPRDAILGSIERRNRGDAGCANTNRTESEIQAISQTWTNNGYRTKAEEDAANEAAIAQALWELVQEEKRKYGYSPALLRARDSLVNDDAPLPGRYDGYGADVVRDAERRPPVPTTMRPPAQPRSPERRDYWQCGLCTLHNPSHAATCSACRNPRPAGMSGNSAR